MANLSKNIPHRSDMNTRTFFAKRKWLCPASEGVDSSLIGSIELTQNSKNAKTEYLSMDAELKLADCTRTTYWDFSIYAHKKSSIPKELRKVRKKAKMVRTFINTFFDSLELACQAVEAKYNLP